MNRMCRMEDRGIRMGMMKWNGMRVLEWKWIRVSVIEVVERKKGMVIDGNEWIQNIDANGNESRDVW